MRLPTTVSPTRSAQAAGAIISAMARSNENTFTSGGSDNGDAPQTSPSASLVGFDPFLPDALSPEKTSRKTAAAPTKSTEVIVPETPRNRSKQQDEHRESSPDSARTGLQDMQKELRAIASQLERDSPRRNASSSPERSNTVSLPQSPLRRRFTLARASSTATTSTANSNRTIFSPFKPPKKGHRKTNSIAESTPSKQQQSEEVARPRTIQSRSISTPTNGSSGRSSDSPSADVLQEVWAGMPENVASPTTVATTATSSSSQKRMESLYIPNLAKPRPTSFLTGRDVVRTSELDATQWQLDIPEQKEFLVAAKATQFLDTYRSKECLLDLGRLQGYSRQDLSQFASGNEPCRVRNIADCHRPIVESLLDCGDDIVEVRGYFCSPPHTDLDQRREVLILERQRQFLVVVRGNHAEQQGKFNKQPETVALGQDVTVFVDRFEAVQELEDALFARLDELTEETPFCDVVFCGHSFGASMATLAAYLYANTRSDQRVAALCTSSPTLGLTDFRWSVHASPNLKVMNVECGGRSGAQQQARHVGHTLRISSSNKQVKAFKFSPGPVESLGVRSRLFKRDRDISEYVQALEELPSWVMGYHKEDGVGVRGKDNESRHMV